MKVLSTAVSLALLISVAGCGGGSALSTVPGATSGSHSPSMTGRHLQTHTRLETIRKSTQQLRHTKDVIGTGPLGLLSAVLDILDAPLVDDANGQVNLALVGINVLSNGVATPVLANSTEQVLNLLQLQTTAAQYTMNLPAGSYDTVQLVVDPSNSSVVFQGQTYPVQFGSIPSDGSTYVGINAPATFALSADGSSATVTADFNVLESVDVEPSVAYINPQVIVAVNASTVSGNVVNQGGQPVANATILALDQYGNVLNTTITGSDGSFNLHAIGAGNVSIVVQNAYTSDSGQNVTASNADATAPPPLPVSVPGGNAVNIGSLTD